MLQQGYIKILFKGFRVRSGYEQRSFDIFQAFLGTKNETKLTYVKII